MTHVDGTVPNSESLFAASLRAPLRERPVPYGGTDATLVHSSLLRTVDRR